MYNKEGNARVLESRRLARSALLVDLLELFPADIPPRLTFPRDVVDYDSYYVDRARELFQGKDWRSVDIPAEDNDNVAWTVVSLDSRAQAYYLPSLIQASLTKSKLEGLLKTSLYYSIVLPAHRRVDSLMDYLSPDHVQLLMDVLAEVRRDMEENWWPEVFGIDPKLDPVVAALRKHWVG